MDLAIHFPNFSLPGEPESLATFLSDSARAAEAGGCSTFTLMDHWFQMEQLATSQDPMLEGYTSLGFLAGRTQRITLGLLVTGVTYRHPGLLAKTVTTLDVLSGGRPNWVSVPHGTSGSTEGWVCRSHRSVSGSNAWRRHSRSASRCGVTTTDRMRDGTTSWPRPSARPSPSSRGPAYSSAAPANERHCGWWPGTPMPATSSHRSPRWWPTNSAYWTATVTPRARPADIERTIIFGSDPLVDIDAFLFDMTAYAALGIGQVWVSPFGPDPARWVEQVCEQFVARLADL